ncbi:DUF2892 domain-containing protein [Pseudoflavitalea sp. G-6-1-2]|uniref:YgaP-like transmembrane domain n=1 Tax=Pseudoflavitalea sp. G-6-1-2 TaxID=2728841 RepID=UPI00146AFE97|nr:YgaP-like transmembrane domain [Pseudoflavitalea sp. G-6-1-2]NML21567.1 DUF2892 domain-containing protein [Pseudoflavitalea sp. G-6-1-2]
MKHSTNYPAWPLAPEQDMELSSEQSRDTRMEHVKNVGDTERVISGIAGGLLLLNGVAGIRHSGLGGLLKAALGGFLLYRGASGNCPVYSAMGKTDHVVRNTAVNIRCQILVEKDRKLVYEFWRKLENLPLFMKHLETVREHDRMQSTWTANLPGYGRLQWDAVIVKDVPGHLIGWQSESSAPLENAGKVEFMDEGPGRCIVKVVIVYRPPAGDIGLAIAKSLTPTFRKLVKKEIKGFKHSLEELP